MYLVMFLCAAPFLLVGLAAFAQGWINYRKSLERNNWPMASGEIISSEIKAKRFRHSISYLPVIRYRYKVNLVEYESNVVRLSESILLGTMQRAEERVEKYQPHQGVNVYYDPEHPETCALETEISISAMLFFVVLGFVFLASGFGFSYLMFSNP
jgi:hypothetical protein